MLVKWKGRMEKQIGRKSDRRHNGQKSDRWAGRPGGRSEGQFCPCLLPTGKILWGYLYTTFELIFDKISLDLISFIILEDSILAANFFSYVGLNIEF